MSRRIVQIATAQSGAYDMQFLYALDNNGVAWRLTNPHVDPVGGLKWVRLPELPSIDTRPPRPTIEPLEGIEP